MNLSRKSIVVLFSIVVLLAMSASGWAAGYAGKKILMIDSYHEGYEWSDGIVNGVKRTIEGKGIELRVVRMDTKRNPDDAFKKAAGLKAKAEIESFKPDVVIAADDNASQYVVMPFYKNASLPIVFCGVNWDATVYGYPYNNATGMVEVTPIVNLLQQFKSVVKGDRVGFIGPDNETVHKEFDNYKKKFGLNLVGYFAKDYEDWKKGFVDLQGKTDFMVIDSDGGLYKEHKADMRAFVEANAQKPSGACYDFMADYAVLTYAKVSEEQGSWSAAAALQILDGKSPKDIPIAENKDGSVVFNARLAKITGSMLPFEVISTAKRVIE
ncbi:MAG: hypothetical protein HZB24_11345 [Desulfobacterales bacterium]|nr:hypothetical protein [Desulfobacterales bacterium]